MKLSTQKLASLYDNALSLQNAGISPHSSQSTAALVTSNPVSLARTGLFEELVLPPLPPGRQKSREELVCGRANALTDWKTDRQLPGSVWSGGGGRREGEGQDGTASTAHQGDREL